MAETVLERQFTWTVLPAGRIMPLPGHPEQMAVFSVLLTPRLLGPVGTRLTVGHFGMQSWPERLAALRFDAFRAQQRLPEPPQRVPHLTLEGQPLQFSLANQLRAWKALFAADLLVKPYQPASYDGRPVHEFPASEAGTEIRDVYTATGRALVAYKGEDPEDNAELRQELRQISETWQAGSTLTSDGPEAEQTPLQRAYGFYRRDASEFTPLASGRSEPDFHDIVARLADHPFLLRTLGLLIDMAVPASRLAGGAAAAELGVVPQWLANDPNPPAHWRDATQRDRSPRTSYSVVGNRFLPASAAGPASTEFAQGMLPLARTGPAPSGNPRFELMPFDVDGAALRLVGAARSDTAEASSGGSAAPGALPALRSAGFALVERDRRRQHDKQLERARRRATADGLLSFPLAADSLLGGYRLDVWDDTAGRWFSLCRRRVRYTIGGVPVGQEADDGGPGGLLEEGWLRPGPVATGAGEQDALYVHQTVARWDNWSLVAERPERPVDTGDETMATADGQPFEAVVECDPGSLPQLRFGRTYRLRARIADLAGGGLRDSEVAPGEGRTEAVVYHRYEPLMPPEIVPTRAFADGEGHDRMVIRSDRDTSVSDYAAAHGYRASDLRHLLAPKCSLELAMRHEGLFDPAMGPDAPASEVNRLFEVARRADRDLLMVDGAEVVGAEGGTHSEPPYVVLPQTGVALPWLADPASNHVTLNTRPRPIDPQTGSPGEVQGHNLPLVAKWPGAWPAPGPLALQVVAAAAGCTMSRSADRRTFTVALGPAERVTLNIPSCPSDNDIRLFGIARWMGVNPDDKEDPGFQQILSGLNRLITPPRTISLVHAVQRPLSDPKGRLTSQRRAGSTDTLLKTDQLKIDIPSTGRIDVHAEWTDEEDLPPAQPRPTTRKAHVGSFDIEQDIPSRAIPAIRQEFGDTRRHRVTYTVTGVSRFQDCFARAVAADPRACLAEGVLQITDVPSTTRPPIPKLLYTMPTFRWSQTADATSTTRSRQGGGLRVFLERPWYISGNDESLAVLTWPTAQATAEAERCISMTGRDPIQDTGAPPAVVSQDQINASVKAQVNLPELQRTIGVSAHPVQFDPDADRWYADIDLSPLVSSSYFPFVRLALARYQPYTTDGVAAVSPAVLTEPVQLPPHRRLTLTREGTQAAVVLDGLGPGGPAPNVVRTELQALDAAGTTGSSAGWTTIFRATAALGQKHLLDIPHSGARPLRIVIQEFETHPQSGRASPTPEGTGRLIHADIVPLRQG
jgi:hypothetical protein